MRKITKKRQITVPLKICQTLNLAPGDFVEIFERDGIGHIVKMKPGSLAWALSLQDKSPDECEFRTLAKRRVAKKFGEDYE